MDFGLSEEQQLLKDTARRFLDKECPRTLVRELLNSPTGYSPTTWRKMADLGWLGMPFPEEYGGSGACFLDLAVILEEMGRALLPGPYLSTVLLGGYPVSEYGTSVQKARLLPRIASGDVILTMAVQETGSAYDPLDINLVAQQNDDGFVLSGIKLFVPNAHVADFILTVAKTSSAQSSQTIFLVDARDPAVQCELLRPIDDSKLCEVRFDGVQVPRENALGEIDGAASAVGRTLERAAIAECLQLVGAAQVALEMSVEHVRNRVQFGRAIGTFQAVQHHCANMAIDLDGARCLTYQAAWMLSEDLPCAKQAATAKAWLNEACHRVVARAHQVHGGVGFISEHDLTLYFKRTVAGETAFGDSDFHYSALANALVSDAAIAEIVRN